MMDKRSEQNLRNVHPALVRVVRRAYEMFPDFQITSGARTLAEQKRLLKIGATRTLDSRHVPGRDGYAKAVDVFVSKRWDWPLYVKFATIMKTAARDCDVPLVWGGDWKTFRDGPHFELPRKDYP